MKRASPALRELAARYGIQNSYVEMGATTRFADEAVTIALLAALGSGVEKPEDVPTALRARRLADARRVMEPVLVQRVGRPATATIRLPEDVDPGLLELELDCGDSPALSPRPLVNAPRAGVVEVDRRRYVSYRLELDKLCANPLEPGYHHVSLQGAATATALLLVAPTCPQAERGWGAFIPVHALRSEHDWGVGSYTEMSGVGRFVAGLGASMLGSLPLYPSFYDVPADPSPYRPISRLAYNELFVDPTALPEMNLCSEARQLLCDPNFLARITAAHGARLVDYEEVARLRRQVLEPMARTLFSSPTNKRRDRLCAFANSHPELVAYASFRAGRDRPQEPDVGTLASRPDSGTDQPFGYHLYCQWAAAEQLSAVATQVGLYADLPIGVHPDGFDPCWSPVSFLTGVHGGAPPDAFFASGQDWGFSPLAPEQIREDGYGYVRAVLARAFRHAGFLRIDHVMGLQRLYMIPDGFDARHGAYVSYRPEEMHALVALEAQRAGAVVVGEDLGTVPDQVRERMAADKMLRSWVFQFESTEQEPLPAPPSGALASLGTHDLPRFGAFLWASDIDEKEASGELVPQQAALRRSRRATWRSSLLAALGVRLDTLTRPELTSAVLRGSLAHLAASAADLVLVDLEEIWDERQPQNRPGTGLEAQNWRHRSALTVSEMYLDRSVSDLLEDLDRLRRGVRA